jgi:hypothetical protein
MTFMRRGVLVDESAESVAALDCFAARWRVGVCWVGRVQCESAVWALAVVVGGVGAEHHLVTAGIREACRRSRCVPRVRQAAPEMPIAPLRSSPVASAVSGSSYSARCVDRCLEAGPAISHRRHPRALQALATRTTVDLASMTEDGRTGHACYRRVERQFASVAKLTTTK